MRWALKRQFLYAVAILVAVVLIALAIYFGFVYHAPSCSDGVQSGDETGVDCGGSCQKICEAPLVSALFARVVPAGNGVYHAVALVRNPETSAGTNSLPYKFSLYDDKDILIAERTGAMYLDPGEVAPLFEADIVTGSRVPVRTFVQFGQAVWKKMSRTDNPIHVTSQNLDQTALTLTAHIQNVTALPVTQSTITAFLYDVDGNIVNASQTVVDNLPARGEKDIVFTWQEPFTTPVVRVEITPRLTSR